MDNNTRTNAVPLQVYQQYAPRTDDIDLLVIWEILMSQKWLILGGTILCTMLAVGAALLLPKEYKAEVIMLPPLSETAEKLNVLNISGNSGNQEQYFFKVEIKELYDELIRNLQSNKMQRQFFDEKGLALLLSKKVDDRPVGVIFMQEFSNKLTVNGAKTNKKDREFVSIILEGQNSDQMVDWLNSFVSFADKETLVTITQSFNIKLERAKDSVSQRIKSLRSIEQSRRLDHIAQLEEAVLIAEKLGWVERPDTFGGLYEPDALNGMRMNMSFSLRNMPLYSRGSKALQAEVNVLKQRKNDDPFIQGLRGLQEQFDFLSSVKQETGNIHAMRLDQDATVDNITQNPKNKRIVVFGFVLGILFSILSAFIRNMVVTKKKFHEVDER